LGLWFLNQWNCLHRWLLQSFFSLPIYNIYCFPWLFILEHMLFSCLTSCCNINIHHIHICSDYLCFSNKLNLCYCHKFPMKQFLHFNELWTIYHFMSIQSIDVACIWKCLLWFLILLCYLCGCHCGLFLLSACLHIVTSHSTICSSMYYPLFLVLLPI
jgi:hypothetical protein